MNVGITGHQERSGIDWEWTTLQMRNQLSVLKIDLGLSSLAAGADQVFAEILIDLRIPVLAVIPMSNYESCFKWEALKKYQDILPKCSVLNLNCSGSNEKCFFDAGKVVVDRSDLMIAVWDGKSAKGKGGTSDVVAYAIKNSKPIIHLNPLTNIINRM